MDHIKPHARFRLRIQPLTLTIVTILINLTNFSLGNPVFMENSHLGHLPCEYTLIILTNL